MTQPAAMRQLESILRAARAADANPEHYSIVAYVADAPVQAFGDQPVGDIWVLQGSIHVMHGDILLDTLVAGANIPPHARPYRLRASDNGCVIAYAAIPTRAAAGSRAIVGTSPPKADAPPPRSTGSWAALRANLRDRLAHRWPFIVLAAITLQALDLVFPLAAGFAVDEVLISEHRHAWTLCLACGVTAAFLRAMLQSSAHRTLFWRTPQDLIPRGVAYAAWLQGIGAWLAALFECIICPPLAAIMAAGFAIQLGILVGALPRQKRWAEASATQRWQRARRLRGGLRHAESLVAQGFVPTLAAEAAYSQPDADVAAAGSPRASTVAAWLCHIVVMVVAAHLCQNDRLSLGMVAASLLINLQMHAQVRGLLTHAGDFLRPTYFDASSDAPCGDCAALRHHMGPGEPLAVSGGEASERTHLARSLCAAAARGEAQYVGPRSTLPTGSLRHAVVRDARASVPEVLRALAFSGAQNEHGLDAALVADDPRLSTVERTKLHIAHALCAAPGLLVIDGVLDACGRSEANALLTNLTRALPQSQVVLFTQRSDLARLCHHWVTLSASGERA